MTLITQQSNYISYILKTKQHSSIVTAIISDWISSIHKAQQMTGISSQYSSYFTTSAPVMCQRVK